jgi:anti-sigma-K factor RskA
MTPAHSRDCPMAEQSVGWVLHALEPEEELEVEGHLVDCSVCRTIVRETEETLGVLGGSVEQLEPPPGLRARILDAAAATPQEKAPEPAPEIPDAPPPARPQRSRPAAVRTGPWGRFGVLVAAAVAVAAIAGLGVYSAQLRSQRDAEAARAQSVVAMVQQMSRPGAQHAFLASAASGQTVAAVVSDGGMQTVLPVDLPTNGDDRVYVLWGLPAAGNPAPLGTFDVAGGAASALSVGSTVGGAGFAQYAISIEPGRVAPASPTDVVASGRAET